MRRLALPGAVPLALFAVFLVARGTQPGPATVKVQGGQTAAVTSVSRSCPPLASGTAAGEITMVAVSAHAAHGAAAAAATPAGDATFRAVLAAPAGQKTTTGPSVS